MGVPQRPGAGTVPQFTCEPPHLPDQRALGRTGVLDRTRHATTDRRLLCVQRSHNTESQHAATALLRNTSDVAGESWLLTISRTGFANTSSTSPARSARGVSFSMTVWSERANTSNTNLSTQGTRFAAKRSK